MSYVILVNDDDTLYGSHKERLMQRQKLVNELVFIVDPIYRNTYDMTDATVMLEYVLPVSRRYKTEILELSKERYNDCFLQYKLPFDTQLSSEAGNIELQLTFAWTELDLRGNGIQRVRKTSPTTIEIIPISAWSDIVPDEALSALDERLIKLDAQMRGIEEYMDVLDNNKVDNLVYNENEETLQLSSKGVGIGDKVSVRDMLDDGVPVVDLNSPVDGEIEDDNSCNCGCCDEDEIVEIDDVVSSDATKDEDDEIVEFE